MGKIEQRQKDMLKVFEPLKTWEDRYKKIIEMGKALPPLPDNMQIDEALVKGCQSRVWLHGKLNENGEVEYRADSDALIVKGLVALVVTVYSGAKPDEILDNPPDYLQKLDLANHLTPSRANGVQAFIKQVFLMAYAYKLRGIVQ